MNENYKMNEGRHSSYYFQFSERETGKILLEGNVTGGNKQDCKNHAWSKFGWNHFGDDNIKLYMKRVEN